MTKKNKQKRAKPDEMFVAGPLRFGRYGKNLVYEANWPEGAFAEMQRRALETFPEVTKEIDALVEAIAQLVGELPPGELLHRAWWENAARATKMETEADVGVEDAVAMRMIDYIQSIIASVKPAVNQRDRVTEDEWQTLREKVSRLFHEVNVTYHICRTAKERAENPRSDEDVEEFQYKAQMYWCNVRGAQYQAHQIAHLRDLFLPHTAVFQELFGLSADAFVDELGKIWHALTFGIQDIFKEMKSFQEDTMAAVSAKLADARPRENVEIAQIVKEVIAENGWHERQQRVFGRTFGTDLFDVEKVTALPQMLVAELTWAPGEESDFFAAGEFRGWPLRIWSILKRPFVRLDGRCYCFDLSALFDNIYRVMQRVILRLKPDYREEWKLIQQAQSEELPLKYLEKILPGAAVYRSVYYRWHSEPGASAKDWCETDGLLIYDDHLFVVEARAGAFTYTSPANDFPAFIASLRNLVLKPATQGQRFLDYLSSADTVAIFNRDHDKVCELRKADFRQITICPVTLDPFTEVAAQVQHLRKIGVDVGNHPVWSVSLDDIRVYADVFEDPLWFLHYVDQRMRAFASDIIQVDDEFDHLGLYLKHNNYSLYAEEMRGESRARIGFAGYRSEIDKFFRARLLEPATPCPLKQETPARILEIIAVLSGGGKSGRAALSSYLLDLDGDTRRSISDHIDGELAAQPRTRRPKPFSSHGETPFTVFCYSAPLTERNAVFALDHARAVLLLNNDKERLLLELRYTDAGALAEVDWQWVRAADIPSHELSRLKQTAEKLRKARVAKARAERRKIGRNERCPCGSGKKYKRCCIDL